MAKGWGEGGVMIGEFEEEVGGGDDDDDGPELKFGVDSISWV